MYRLICSHDICFRIGLGQITHKTLKPTSPYIERNNLKVSVNQIISRENYIVTCIEGHDN